MAAKSYTQADSVINHYLRNNSQTSPTTVYAGLFTTAPSNPGDAGTEVTGGSYARVATTFGAPASGTTSNSGSVGFPTATANWGTVVAVGIYDALSGGTLLYYGNLTTSKVVQNGDTASFAASALQLTEQ